MTEQWRWPTLSVRIRKRFSSGSEVKIAIFVKFWPFWFMMITFPNLLFHTSLLSSSLLSSQSELYRKTVLLPQFLLVESGILGFGILNSGQEIRNPANDWSPKSTLQWQRIRNPPRGVQNPRMCQFTLHRVITVSDVLTQNELMEKKINPGVKIQVAWILQRYFSVPLFVWQCWYVYPSLSNISTSCLVDIINVIIKSSRR